MLTIALGDGDGGFGTPATISLGDKEFTTPTVGDFNGDAHVDLAVPTENAGHTVGTVAMLYGNGDGTFDAPVHLSISFVPDVWGPAALTGDFNGDGKLDLIFGPSVLMLGDGAGGFATPIFLDIGGREPGDYFGPVAVADLDDDGCDDIVSAGGYWPSGDSDHAAVFTALSDGAGGFLPATRHLVEGSSTITVAAADFTGEGVPDVAVSVTSPSAVWFLRGNGRGGLTSPTSVTPSDGVAVRRMVIHDADGDGRDDVVCGCYPNYFPAESSLAVLFNRTGPSMTVNGDDIGCKLTDVTLNSSVRSVTEMRFRNAGGTWSAWLPFAAAADWTLPGGDGPKTVEAQYRDAGGAVTALSDDIILDTVAPETTDDAPAVAWLREATIITFTASDPTSGVARTQCKLDDGPWRIADSITLSSSQEGPHTILYRSTDNAGNVEGAHTITIGFDYQPPTTNLKVGDEYYVPWPNTWHRADLTLTFWGQDFGSGTATTYHKVDSGAWSDGPSVTIPAPADGSNDGVHTLYYYSVDVSGLIEETRTIAIRIDTTPPAAPTITDPYAGGWHRSPAQLDVAATDATSGVWYYLYQLDGGEWSGCGTLIPVPTAGHHTIVARAVDYGGNQSASCAPFECDLLLDGTPPTMTVIGADDAWHDSDVNLEIQATDSESGVGAVMYEIDPSPWTHDFTWGDTLTVAALADHSNDGVHTVAYQSADNVQNWSATESVDVKIDTGPPVTTVSGDGWHNGPAQLTFTAHDAGAGVDYTEYQVDGGAWQRGTKVDFTDDGASGRQWTVRYRAVDLAGHVEDPNMTSVGMDHTPPVTSVTGADDLWHCLPVTLAFTATDSVCLVDHVEYRVDDSPWVVDDEVTIEAPTDRSNDGVHNIDYRAVDAAGNVEAPKTVQVRIDCCAPGTSADGVTDAWQNQPVEVHFVTDADASGIAHTDFQVDAGGWQTGSETTVSGAGEHSLDFCSVDNAGNVEPTHTIPVRIDTSRPCSTIASRIVVKRGTKATIRFRVTDAAPTCGHARVWVKVSTLGGRRLMWVAKDIRPVNCPDSVSVRITLKKGRYVCRIVPQDVAGNKAARVGRAALIVR